MAAPLIARHVQLSRRLGEVIALAGGNTLRYPDVSLIQLKFAESAHVFSIRPN